MRLFSSELFRNFGIGFVLGAVLIVGGHAEGWNAAVASPAQAAEMPAPSGTNPAPSGEFVIAPVEG
ncbi:hypothetical protein [Porphyrobacter sp. AAP82]|uniref:hypothetical protein n=1 Tax=Porphyrobacter sp. AAP82 TaxID=1248917 RepID=UPI0002EA21A8|nr:hypothetical protein [Porphyrobacter sp. AAP82]